MALSAVSAHSVRRKTEPNVQMTCLGELPPFGCGEKFVTRHPRRLDDFFGCLSNAFAACKRLGALTKMIFARNVGLVAECCFAKEVALSWSKFHTLLALAEAFRRTNEKEPKKLHVEQNEYESYEPLSKIETRRIFGVQTGFVLSYCTI